MHWFEGSIAEAVTLSKQRNAIFVVFVEGDNDLSAELSSTIDDAAVLSRLGDVANFLAIKLKSGSTNYTHFAQIYQFVPVPSLFFIGRNGTPLEVVCAGVPATNLATRIDRILQEHRKDNPVPSGQTPVQPSTSSQRIKEQTNSLLQSEAAANVPPPDVVMRDDKTNEKTVETPEESSEPATKIQKTEHHEVTKPSQEYDVVCDGDVCVRVPRDRPGPSQPAVPTVLPEAPAAQPEAAEASSSSTSIEEKLERAKELIEARRLEKIAKERELEKQKELERRITGQGVTELKQWQADQELKQMQDERKREKLENNLARQRILEQIAQDRAERRARDLAPLATTSAPHRAATSGDGGSRARIQFKLPDGSSHTAHFAAGDSLGELRRYVADNLQMSASSFSLWTAFPRRELTEAAATLQELELAPSAALLVLPRGVATRVATPSPYAAVLAFLTQLFTTWIVSPATHALSWVRSLLFPPAGPPPPAGHPESPSGPPAGPPPRAPRRRGNVHRLTGDDRGDDNNTWNGNSTQQM